MLIPSSSSYHFHESHYLYISFSSHYVNCHLIIIFQNIFTTMVVAGAGFFPTIYSPIFRREPAYKALKLKSGGILCIAPRFAMSVNRVRVTEEKQEKRRTSWKEYLKQSKEMINADGGPPRWFSPLECGLKGENSPLMLFLPG
jgi:hypothetical protein